MAGEGCRALRGGLPTPDEGPPPDAGPSRRDLELHPKKGKGESWTWTALEAETKLLLDFQEGEWTTEEVEKLILRIKEMSDGHTPLFTSDQIDQLEEALLRVYGCLETPEYRGRGRPPKPRLAPPPDLVYIQLVKEKKGNRVMGVHKRVVFGGDQPAYGNTSYVERNNLTVRQSIARFVRKTLSFSKRREQHRNHLSFYKAHYNLVKTHESLRSKAQATGEWPRRKWIKRTPAMAARITDHIWTLEELLTHKTPINT